MQSQQDRYRLYIDESGDHVFSRKDPNHRYLTLLGIWFRQGIEYETFCLWMQKLKDACFGPSPDDPVVFHRSKILDRKGAFGVLSNPERREKLEAGLCWIASHSTYTIVAVTIDKWAHQDRYASPLHPYHYCLAAMIERYAYHLNNIGATGDVMAESRGKREDVSLSQAYRTVFESGTKMASASTFQRVLSSKELKLRKKDRNICGLQLADLLAHPMQLHMVAKRECESSGSDELLKKRLPPHKLNTRLLESAMGKIRRRPWSDDTKGYGTVWL